MTATEAAAMPEHDPSQGLLLVTDASGVESLLETGQWPGIALRPDQRTADQILFLDCDSGLISCLAILEAEGWDPWQPAGSGACLWAPRIATVTELMDPIQVGVSVLKFLAEQLSQPLRQNLEVVSLDFDLVNEADGALLAGDGREDALLSEIVDQLILNRRSQEVLKVFQWLDGGRQPARKTLTLMEACGVSTHPQEVPMRDLPDRWRAVVPKAKAAEVLATLNSFWKPSE